ncbi:glycosyl transferase family 4-domain-containing protein [Cladorrhinum sp. PSN259]|nr:glycosyl transferase family 4-domain-containing protein [Cladorrhinum sp. PSN259]
MTPPNRSPTRSSRSQFQLSSTETLTLSALSLTALSILLQIYLRQTDGEPLIASLSLSLLAFSATYAMIRWLGPTFMKAGLKGKDMSKVHRKEIPECMGAICAVVYLFVMLVFIPFPFFKEFVVATSGGGNKDVVFSEGEEILAGGGVQELVGRGRLLHKFPISKLASYLSATISLSVITLLGIGDDLFDIRWRHKFFIPAFASIPLLVVYFVDFGVTSIVVPIPLQPYLGELVNVGGFYYVYMASVAIFSPNSINILAGINGIEVAQSIVIALLLAANDCLYLLTPAYPHPATDSHLFSLYFLLPFLGVSFALLWQNWYPAKVFVGDTYCYFAGMVFVVVSILGHFSKTLILLLVPQIFNFVYSAPQLFGLVPCPRHRLPRFNARTGLLEPSVTPWTEERQPKAPIAWGLKLLDKLKLLRVTLDEGGRFVETSNFTILNLWLVWRGPLREDRLAKEITAMQTVLGLFGLFVRHGLALLIFKEDNWSPGSGSMDTPPLMSVSFIQLPNTNLLPGSRVISDTMARLSHLLSDPPTVDEQLTFEPIIKHGHQDLVQAIAFNSYGDRCATGSVDGKIRVFNRHKDGVWRHCDNWTAHSSEITELQWLPPTIYPNLLASLGMEGRFKLWAEDPQAAPGRRSHPQQSGSSVEKHHHYPHLNPPAPLSDTAATMPPPPPPNNQGGPGPTPKAAFETRNSRSPYRSFSMRHIDETRHTYLALLSSDGHLTIYQNEQPENMTDYNQVDELIVSRTTPPAARGEESTFKVMFDPNLEVCYTALRAGVPQDALGLVTVAMDCVRVWRTRDIIIQNLGVASVSKAFYLAAEVPIGVHRGLVRDVAWAGGNVRGYDVIATAGQDGWVRVFRVDTPLESGMVMRGRRAEKSTTATRGWTSGEVKRHAVSTSQGRKAEKVKKNDEGHHHYHRDDDRSGGGGGGTSSSGIGVGLQERERKMGGGGGLGGVRDHGAGGGVGQVRHTIAEISRLNEHKTPVWRVGFDDDGQVLGSVGDEGRLMHYRQMPDGGWLKSSELAMIKLKMAAP